MKIKHLSLAAIVALGALLVSGCSSDPVVSDLSLVNNPNKHVPQAGILTFTTDKPVITTLTISDGDESFSVTPELEAVTSHHIPVLGMKADRTYSVFGTVEDADGNTAVLDSMQITTPPLPSDFPPIKLTQADITLIEPGVNVLNIFRWTGMFDDDSTWGLLAAVDEMGEVVWYYKGDSFVGEGRRMRNGNLFFSADIDGRLTEIDMLGNVVRQWHPSGVDGNEAPEGSISVDSDAFHHDVIEIPNGNFIALGLEVIKFDDFPVEYPPATARGPLNVASDVILEFAPDGSTVRKYRVADILDPERLGQGSLSRDFYEKLYEIAYDSLDMPADITHSNAIYYIPEEDAVLVSSYLQCVIYKVDMKTGDLVWLLGDSYGWENGWSEKLLTPVGDVTWPCHQHGIELTPRGTLLVFDNGGGRNVAGQQGLPPAEMYSRAVEYSIDEANGTVEEVWTYGPEQEHFSSVFICDADYLSETGNVLITDGGRFMDENGEPLNTFGGHQWGRVFEVTYGDDPKKIWEVVVKDSVTRYSIYRTQKLKSLYPGLDKPTG